jgi:hypothetical protein
MQEFYSIKQETIMEEPKKDPEEKNYHPLLIMLLVIFLPIIIFLAQCHACVSDLTSGSGTSLNYKTYKVGQVVTLPYQILGTTQSSWDALVELSAKRELDTMIYMAYDGLAFIVEEGTHAKIISTTSFYTIEVQILDGQQQGRIGWMSSELL